MGGALRKFFMSFSIRKFKFCMVGVEAAGKTTILYKLHLGEVIATTPTIGFNLETVKVKKSQLSIWDISGSKRSRSLWASYYKGINGLIFVIDSEDRQGITEAQEEFSYALSHDDLKHIPVLILANKQDLPGAMTVTEVVEKLELFKIRDRPWHLQGTCALSGEGLEQGFSRLLQMARNFKCN